MQMRVREIQWFTIMNYEHDFWFQTAVCMKCSSCVRIETAPGQSSQPKDELLLTIHTVMIISHNHQFGIEGTSDVTQQGLCVCALNVYNICILQLQQNMAGSCGDRTLTLHGHHVRPPVPSLTSDLQRKKWTTKGMKHDQKNSCKSSIIIIILLIIIIIIIINFYQQQYQYQYQQHYNQYEY